MERRRAEREQARAARPTEADEPAAPSAGRPVRPEPPDPPGLETLRSAARPHAEEIAEPVAAPRAAPSAPRARPQPRRAVGSAAGRRKTVVRRVDPWSVFRLSLVLYFCLLIVVTLGLVIFWLVLSRMGPMRSMLESIEQLGIPIDPGLVLTVLVPVGVLNVLVWSAANLFFAVLYNLVADLVGGLRVTLSDDDR